MLYRLLDEVEKEAKTKMLLDADCLRPDTDISDAEGQELINERYRRGSGGKRGIVEEGYMYETSRR